MEILSDREVSGVTMDFLRNLGLSFSWVKVIAGDYLRINTRQLGVVVAAPDPSKKIAVYTEKSDILVVRGMGEFSSMKEFKQLGKWDHCILQFPDVADLRGARLDLFGRQVSLEILQAGETVRQEEYVRGALLKPDRA